MAFNKESRRKKIRSRIRGKVVGSAETPRLSVFRSNKEIYAQVINDQTGATIVSASSLKLGEAANKVEKAKLVGKALAERAIAAGVTAVVFDRGGYLYHGRVKSLAEGAREGGLKF
ncbi:MAG: hypothetical protein RL220_765 [Bacteroidota bacterium]|jgi:large subunit ribosomal protein L18